MPRSLAAGYLTGGQAVSFGTDIKIGDLRSGRHVSGEGAVAVALASGEKAGPASRKIPPLSTVVYSSRALTPFSDRELQGLMQTAQARNHQERVTGVVLYDNSRFFQWLEGPSQGVERIMSSIRSDRRHTDVGVVAERTSTSRRFGEWDMKLAMQGADPAVWQGDILEPPREIIEDLHRQPAAAPTLLVKLLPPPGAASESALAESLEGWGAEWRDREGP